MASIHFLIECAAFACIQRTCDCCSRRERGGYGVWQHLGGRSADELAVIAAGYADGYPAWGPSGTPVAINGHLAHIAGRISMDMMTVALPDEVNVEVGDWAELWGRLCRLRILVSGAIPLPTPSVVLAGESIASIQGRPRNEEAKDRLCVWRLRRGPCQVAGSVSSCGNGTP